MKNKPFKEKYTQGGKNTNLRTVKSKLKFSKTRIRDTVEIMHHIRLQTLLFYNWILEEKNDNLNANQQLFVQMQKLFILDYNLFQTQKAKTYKYNGSSKENVDLKNIKAQKDFEANNSRKMILIKDWNKFIL